MLLAACGSSPPLPVGADAYALVPTPAAAGPIRDYRIGPLDKISISVFGQEKLNMKEVQVDSAGTITFPLIGTVQAGGKTSAELSRDIAARLNAQFLRNPQVSVNIDSSVSQRVTVMGAVTEAGVYEISGPTTLLEAVAMAKGESRTARMNEVAVFRTINGQRMGALFDMRAIRRGEAEDPQILGNDVVVVGNSAAKSVFRDTLGALPALAIFVPLL